MDTPTTSAATTENPSPAPVASVADTGLSNNSPDGLVTDAQETLSDFMKWIEAKIARDPASAKAALSSLMSDAEEIGLDAIKAAVLDIAAFKVANPGTLISDVLKTAGTAIGGLISKL